MNRELVERSASRVDASAQLLAQLHCDFSRRGDAPTVREKRDDGGLHLGWDDLLAVGVFDFAVVMPGLTGSSCKAEIDALRSGEEVQTLMCGRGSGNFTFYDGVLHNLRQEKDSQLKPHRRDGPEMPPKCWTFGDR